MPDSPIDLTARPPFLRLDDAARDRTVQRLSDAFARGMIPVEELEVRMEAVYRAAQQNDLDALVADLGASPSRGESLSPTVHVPQKVRALFSNVRNSRIVTVAGTVRIEARFGSVENTTLDVMPARLELSAVAGTIELDLRHTVFPPGMTEITVSARMGGVEIYLPATVTVDNQGSGVLGTFQIDDQTSARGSSAALTTRERAYVRITGLSVMGNVEIHHVPV